MPKKSLKDKPNDQLNVSSDSDWESSHNCTDKTCKYCDASFNSAKDRSTHEQTCDANSGVINDPTHAFKCTECSCTFKFKTGFDRHVVRHQFPGGFICLLCNEMFTTAAARIVHREKQHKVFRCRICVDETFKTATALQHHTQSVHSGKMQEDYVCPVCGVQFRSKLQLQNHSDSKCSTVKTHACDKCDCTYSSALSLVRHKLKHTGEKPFLCNFCGKNFLSGGQLQVHVRSHTKEKPFQCGVCKKSFSYRESLVTHSSVHTGIKPFLCQCCGGTFSCIGNLIKHRKNRASSCGLPQYDSIKKIAPRASAKLKNKSKKGIGTEGNGAQASDLVPISRAADVTEALELSQNDSQLRVCKKEMIEDANIKDEDLKPKACKSLNKTSDFQSDLTNIPKPNTEKNNVTIEINSHPLLPKKRKYLSGNTKKNQNTEKLYEDEPISTKIQRIITRDDGALVPQPGTSSNVHQHDCQQCCKSFSRRAGYLKHLISVHKQTKTDSSQDHCYSITEEKPDCSESLEKIVHQTIDEEFKTKNSNFIIVPLKIEHTGDEISLQFTNQPLRLERHVQTNKTITNETMHQGNNSSITVLESSQIKTSEFMSSKKRGKEIVDVIETLLIIPETDPIKLEAYPKEANPEESQDGNVQRISDCNEIAIEIVQCETKDFNVLPSKESPMRNPEIIVTIEDILPKQPVAINVIESDKQLSPEKEIKTNVQILPEKEQSKKSPPSPLECKDCSKTYTFRKSYNKHLLQVHNKKIGQKHASRSRFFCDVCNKTYCNAGSLKTHHETHGPDGKLVHKCSCCRLHFATPADVNSHQLNCHVDKLHCKECNKIFDDPDKLSSHTRYQHKGLPPKQYTFVCETCGRTFKSKVAMRDHERSRCGEQPIYKCDQCNKSYHSAGSLKTHKSMHTGVLPYLCKYCGKAFRTQGQVSVHERCHTGKKPYKCQKCDKQFAYRESLLTHLTTHNGLKRFLCRVCKSRFSCISNLKSHHRSNPSTCGKKPAITKQFSAEGNIISTTIKSDFS